MIFRLPNVLTPDQVAAIRARIKPESFVDGMQSAGAYVQNIKRNREMRLDSEAANELNDTIQSALMASNDFQIITVPAKIGPFLFSCYRPGEFYGDHADNAIMGKNSSNPMRADLSMTVFLSDPSEYEGGELVLDTDLMPSAWKLPAGHAVVYPSYSLHRVDPVRRGERFAAVSWIQSRIRLEQQRQTLIDIAMVMNWMLKSNVGGSAHEHPEFRRLEKIRSNLTRMWAD